MSEGFFYSHATIWDISHFLPKYLVANSFPLNVRINKFNEEFFGGGY